MPKWIRRWLKRLRTNFPQCRVTYKRDYRRYGYLIKLHYGKHWWGILLNGSPCPTVWQNRKWFRQRSDYAIREAINAVDK